MHRTRFRLTLLLALVSVLAVGGVTPASAGPARQMALGVSQVPDGDMAQLDQFITDTGRNPAIYSVWSSWGSGPKVFPRTLIDKLQVRATVAQPITPMVIWQPVDGTNLNSQAFTYRKIIRGNHDTYIRTWAQAAKDYGKPVLLRFAHEMNGTWFPWSTQRFDNTPTRFKLAWQHVWNIFRGPDGVGATNVKFLWSPNQPCGNCDTMASVWPGKKYVDYVGFSSFNWSTPQKWKSMVKTFNLSMTTIATITAKPVIVTETASSPTGGDKTAWIANGFPAVYAKWPQLRGVIYFNVDTTNVGQRDWRLTTPDDGPLQAYAAILTDTRFQGSVP